MTATEITNGRPASGGYKVDVSRGGHNGRVSSEWFSRPDDEKHLSLSELYASVKRRAEPPQPEPLAKVPTGSPEAARRLWAMGKPIAGTLAERYLAGRGIVGVRTISALRFHPNCYYWCEDRTDKGRPEARPALLAKVTDADGNITGLHRTWLDPENANKAPLDPNRKTMGHLLGHSVRIGAPSRMVAAGEGLETMLSLRMAIPRLPVIAALSANHLAALAPPSGIERIYIAADADEAGRIATHVLAERAHEQGIETVPLHFRQGDANEDLRALGLQDFRTHLQGQLAHNDAAILLPSSAA